MITAVLSPFLLALAAPFLFKIFKQFTGWILAVLPAGLTAYFIWLSITGPMPIREYTPWLPGLDIALSFYLDGLSLLFLVLVLGIGTMIVIYAGGYLHGHPALGRFYMVLLGFMGSMVGLVAADNILTMFVFWELTGITSYMLIGFHHEEKVSRWNALQALLVTTAGGLALMGGLIMMVIASGSMEISEINLMGDALKNHPLYAPILFLVLAGAFTKSAQVPFHFWLPNAMAAPTPVSAYLHSATMVKAGVYLLARFTPALGGTELWFWNITIAGALTFLMGAALGLFHTDLKKILAYTTLSVLGLLTMLIGIGTEYAIKAMVIFLMAHALYKASLFMVAGAIDHEAGTREVHSLGGLRKAMPITFGFALLAVLSNSGLPPFLGFLGKEFVYEAGLSLGHDSHPVLSGEMAHLVSYAVIAVAVLANAFMMMEAFSAGFHPFTGSHKETPKHPHEAPVAMLAGPAILATLGLVFGVMSFIPGHYVLEAAASAVAGKPLELHLGLWHGITTALILSIITVSLGAGLYLIRFQLWKASGFMKTLSGIGAEKGYELSFNGMVSFAKWQTRFLQNGSLRMYMLYVMVGSFALIALQMYRSEMTLKTDFETIRYMDAILFLLMVIASVGSILARTLLTAVAFLGLVGYGVTLIYILYGAPDLAITQLLTETLQVILFVLIVYKMPDVKLLSSNSVRAFDAVVSVVIGVIFSLLTMLMYSGKISESIGAYYEKNSYLMAHGRNVVNVILVDFRGIDTMGEITVLGLAAVGVYTLLKFRVRNA